MMCFFFKSVFNLKKTKSFFCFASLRMARRVLMAEVSMGQVRGRPRIGWMDGVKVALGNRGMTVEAA